MPSLGLTFFINFALDGEGVVRKGDCLFTNDVGPHSLPLGRTHYSAFISVDENAGPVHQQEMPFDKN